MTAPNVATAAGFGGRPAPRARLRGWNPVNHGALRGFARIELPYGLILDHVAVYFSNGHGWATLSQRPVLDREGRHVRPGGRGQYAAVAEWRNRELADEFSRRVIELVQQADPDALPPANGDSRAEPR
jgi:hypothetical protein